MDFELLDSLIQSKKEQFWEMSDQIWGFAEMRFKEDQSSRLQMEFLRNEGFTVEEGIGDIPTAFSARAGSGRPVIGLLGEYDALPKLSQEADVTVKKPLAEGAPGHGCGHHLLGTGCLEAAVAVKDYLLEHPGQGTIVYFGCPAEEGGAGKAFMVREGCFKDCDICLAWHPYSATFASVSSLANARIIYRFTGKSAHAATSPYLGRSALDAVELMNVGCNYLREHMIDAARIHYAYSDPGGTAPNVVQSHAVIKYEVRAPKVSQVQELFTRVVDVARGATLMTGTKMKYEITMAFSDYVPNRTLGAVVDQCMRELGAPEWTEADYRLAAEFLRTYPRTTMVGIREKLGYYFEPEELDAALEKPLDRIIHPFNPKETAYSSGSTDVGDVGYAAPTLNINIATACIGNVGHSWQMVAQSCSPLAHKGHLTAAKVLALSCIRTMDRTDVIEAAKKELHKRNGGHYTCPLPDSVEPPLDTY